MEIDNHFTYLIYPFKHKLSDRRRDDLIMLDARWQPWWTRLTPDERARALDDSYFFLPPVRSLLFPETDYLHSGDAIQQAPMLQQLAGLRLDTYALRFRTDGVLRLTYKPEYLQRLQGNQSLQLTYQDGSTNYRSAIELCWIDVVIFPDEIGFIIIKLQSSQPASTIDHLIDLMYYARIVHPPKPNWILAEWTVSDGHASVSFATRDLIDYALQGLAQSTSIIDETLFAFLNRQRQHPSTERYTASVTGQVYGQMCRLYSYVCLSKQTQVPSPVVTKQGHVLFKSLNEQIIYELATCSSVTDPNYEPHALGVSQLFNRGRIAFWGNWEGLSLHDNTVFLATEPAYFTRTDLPHNVGSDYFYLYLLVLYQKLRLSTLSGLLQRPQYKRNLAQRLQQRLPGIKVIDSPNIDNKHLRITRDLWDGFVLFRNHYWLGEVTFRPQGTEIYRLYQQGMGVQTLYDAVSDQARELRNHYEERAQRRIGILLTILTVVGLPATILGDLFSGIAVVNQQQTPWHSFIIASLFLYGIVALCCLGWWLRRGE